MPTTHTEASPGREETRARTATRPAKEHQFTLPDEPSLFASLRDGLREWRQTSRQRTSASYGSEQILPLSEMKPWYHGFFAQVKSAFEKPDEPIGVYNRQQEKKRFMVVVAAALIGAAAAWAIAKWATGGEPHFALGVIAGAIAGEILAIFVFKKKEYPPDIWQGYRLQRTSWVNSGLVHAVVILAIVLPYYISRMKGPVTAAPAQTTEVTPLFLPPAQTQAGGGGGGGARTPTPASKGKAPVFAKIQLAPPEVKLPKITPKMPVQPTLLGPPEMKLPQMAENAQLGDPLAGVPAPPTQGPGYGGGIGSGQGTGVGPGKGGGLGPGTGAGTGGGVYSVGGGVSAPVPIYDPQPPYSDEARKAKYQGTVVLLVLVDAQGNVKDVQVVKPLGMGLDETASETVKTWKFKPALRNNSPVPVRLMIDVTFQLF